MRAGYLRNIAGGIFELVVDNIRFTISIFFFIRYNIHPVDWVCTVEISLLAKRVVLDSFLYCTFDYYGRSTVDLPESFLYYAFDWYGRSTVIMSVPHKLV